MNWSIPVVAVMFFGAPAWAQEHETTNPYTSPEDVAAGGRIYRSHCANCHGINGEGGRGPDLTRGRYRHGSTDQELYETISEGIPGTEMAGIFFEGRQMWQLVAFVRSLSAGANLSELPGDPKRGAELFWGKGGCTQCHMVNGEGGRSGPNLDEIGASRSAVHIKRAILKPEQQVLPVNWMVRAVTKDGKKISGRRLNEDTFSIQLLDTQERLVSLDKSELESYEIVKESPMPSYAGMLSESEVDDIVAYLAGLAQRGTAR